MYARGILFGKMVIELGDTCTIKNEKNGLYADLEFKTKVGLRYSVIGPISALAGLFLGDLQRYRGTDTQPVDRGWRGVGQVE
jgi:hypothetical protein